MNSYHLPPNAVHVVVEGSKESAVAALLQASGASAKYAL
jgi:hypothetical protein